jgi:hypothetical protein
VVQDWIAKLPEKTGRSLDVEVRNWLKAAYELDA